MRRWTTKDYIPNSSRARWKHIPDNLIFDRKALGSFELSEAYNGNNRKFHDPFQIRGMYRAVKRIDEAIRSGEAITLYGDYSVQGVLGTSMLYRAFRKLGVEINYYIDDSSSRSSGISCDAIDYIRSLATGLVITVDTGGYSMNEINYCRYHGMDAIVLDHRTGRNLSRDTIFINPGAGICTYPCKDLSGSGIAFKLIQGLWKYYGLSSFEDILDIAVLGTLYQDCEPVGENEVISSVGLEKFQSSEKCGIQALKAVTNLINEVSTEQISIEIIPILDSACRLYDSRLVVELFTTNDYDKALQIAKYLVKETRSRYSSEGRVLCKEF